MGSFDDTENKKRDRCFNQENGYITNYYGDRGPLCDLGNCVDNIFNVAPKTKMDLQCVADRIE